MKIWKKLGASLLAAALLSTTLAPAAMAEERQKVGRINLTIDTDIRVGRDGGEVNAVPAGSNAGLYYVDSCEVTNDSGDTWSKSDPPKVDIILGVEDEDANYFESSASSNFRLTFGPSTKPHFYKVKFLDAHRKDSNGTLILTVQLLFDKNADISTATAPSNLRWDSTSKGTGTWDAVSSSKYYQVQLIKDGSETGPIRDIYNTYYDFKDQLTAPGNYQFKVRSVKSSNSAKSAWVKSDSWNVTSEDVASLGNTPVAPPPAPTSGPANSVGGPADNGGGPGTASGPAGTSGSANPSAPAGTNGPGNASSPAGTNGPQTSEEGSWVKAADGVRWWWRNSDGSYPASAWKEINGQWYYFDSEGYMATGWVQVNGKSYYLDPATGAMYANTRTPDNYWVDGSGAWVPGA